MSARTTPPATVSAALEDFTARSRKLTEPELQRYCLLFIEEIHRLRGEIHRLQRTASVAAKPRPSGQLLTLNMVAERTSIALQTWRRWASCRKIPTVTIGRRVLVEEAELDKLVEQGRREAYDHTPRRGRY